MRIFERFAVGGMILFVLSGPVAVAQEENDLEVQPTPVVTIRDAAIRRGPSATAPVATTIHASTPLLVIGHSYGWMRVAGPNNMVGWISRELVGSPATPAEAFGIGVMSIRAESAGPCMANFDSCPPSGCATEKGDKAINERKRHQVTGTGASLLTLDDFLALQMHCLKDPDPVGEGATPSPSDRKTKLRGLTLKGGRTAGEGDSVMLSGYLVGKPHATGAESVNCGFSAAGETDFHINVAASPRSSEYQSVVVEMIPQKRPDSWTTGKLIAAEKAGMPIFVSGQLLYDSKHFINAKPGAKNRANQPKRFSLWEIHPTRAFLVCPTRDCDMHDAKSDGWVKLADWTP